MQGQKLHIVCLQVPYPPDYGGLFDLFWKLKYLYEQGVEIYLHCFNDGRGEQEAVHVFCKEVYYYRRVKGWRSVSFLRPYIVTSRTSKLLRHRLLEDDYPVLLEGIHCSELLYRDVLKNRRVILRLHNIEADYYAQLSRTTPSLLNGIYFSIESWLLKRYEPQVVKKADTVLSVSQKDVTLLKNQGFSNVQYLPVFLPWNKVFSPTGKGNYCLYHGNLSIAENDKVALWLVQEVFSKVSYPCTIAGKKPSSALRQAIKRQNNCNLVENPTSEEMELLLQEAHINVLPSATTTGVKLKLLHALFCGRFCLVNKKMVAGTGLESLCAQAETSQEFINNIQLLFRQKTFSEAEQNKREGILLSVYDNRKNARQLKQIAFT